MEAGASENCSEGKEIQRWHETTRADFLDVVSGVSLRDSWARLGREEGI